MAFVVGAVVPLMVLQFLGPWPLSVLIMAVCPGGPMATPLVRYFPLGEGLDGAIFGLAVLSALINGLIYSLGWYLARIARAGTRAALVPLIVGVGVWGAWCIHWGLENRPKPVPPPAPVDLASPLAGRWEGVIHGARGDVPTILVFHPRTDGTLDGFFYVRGYFLGELREGAYAGDSLHFEHSSFYHQGRVAGTELSIEEIGGGASRMSLRFVTRDTTRLALPDISEFDPSAERNP